MSLNTPSDWNVVKYTKHVFRAPKVTGMSLNTPSKVTGIVVKYTKHVFRAPKVTGIVVKYTEVCLRAQSQQVRL